jgi:hypothetical protein
LATYTVRRSKHATLVATTVDTVKFSTKPKTVEVRNLDATAVILFRSDGEVPAVNGDDTERLGPGERLEVDAANVDPPQVQLISSSTPGTPFARLPDGVQAHHTCLGAGAESESPLNERAPSQGRGAAQQNSENALWDFTAHPNPPTISNSSSQTIVQLRGSARMGTEPLYAVGFAAETERWQLRRKQHKRFGWTPGHIRIHTRRHRSRDRLARGNVLRNVWIWRNPNLPSQRPDY